MRVGMCHDTVCACVSFSHEFDPPDYRNPAIFRSVALHPSTPLTTTHPGVLVLAVGPDH